VPSVPRPFSLFRSRVLLGLLVVAAGLVPATPTAAVPTAPQLLAAGATSENLPQYGLGTRSFQSGHLYIAFLQLSETSGSLDETPGLVGTGTSWTQIDAGEGSGGGLGVSAYRFAPTSNVGSVALTTGTLSTQHEGFAFSILDVAGGFSSSSPVAQYKAGSSSAATGYTLTLPAQPASDSLVVASFAHAAAEGSTPNAGWTEVAGSDLNYTRPVRGVHAIFDDSAPSRTPGSSWATSSARRGVAIEIPSPSAPPPSGMTLAAAGDICGNLTACTRTSDRVIGIDPDVVVTTGDLAYPNGTLQQFRDRYCGSYPNCTRWGRPAIQSITLPGYGNHDCFDVPRDTGATKQGCDGAVDYFGADSNFGTDIVPGIPGSYYAVRGSWLIVVLNAAGNEGSGDATPAEIEQQRAALDAVLAADDHQCEVLAWHHARYASGDHGNNLFVDPWFDTAYDHGVDIVLNGHAHSYERFLPQDGDGNQVADGVTEFVVGTGGATLDAELEPRQPNSAIGIIDYGVLKLELGDDGTFSWAFLDDVTAAVDDAGSGTCHA
jgi:hypothetical protein